MVPVGATTLTYALPVTFSARSSARPAMRRHRHRRGALGLVDPDGGDRQAFVLVLLRRVGRASVVTHDAEHVLGVPLVAREGAELVGELRGGRVGLAAEDGGDGARPRHRARAIVGDAVDHQQRADVRVPEAERSELVGELGDAARGELRHQHRDLEHDRPDARGVNEEVDVEALGAVELDEVQARKVARRVVEEHVLRARVQQR